MKEKTIYYFENWLEYLSYNGHTITTKHYDFEEFYNNLDTFKNNLKEYEKFNN